jgi:hypothetical protein
MPATAVEEPLCRLSDNKFFLLSMEFNPDECLYVPGRESPPTIVTESPEDEFEDPDTLENEVRQRSTTGQRKKPKKSKTKKIKASTTTTTTTPSPWIVDGVDLRQVALILLQGNYLVTSKTLAKRIGYIPEQVEVFMVAFAGNAEAVPLKFAFDAAFFGKQKYSARLIAGALAFITKKPFTEDLLRSNVLGCDEGDDSLFFQRVEKTFYEWTGQSVFAEDLRILSSGGESMAKEIAAKLYSHKFGSTTTTQAPLAVVVKKGGRKSRVRPNEDEAFDKVLSLVPDIRVYSHGSGMKLFILESTMKDETSPPILANLYKTHDAAMTQQFYFIVEANILDQMTTPDINTLLNGLQKTNRRESAQALLFRRTILGELDDLATIHFGSDPDRVNKLRHIKVHHSKPVDADSTYFRFYWSINGSEDPLRPLDYGF